MRSSAAILHTSSFHIIVPLSECVCETVYERLAKQDTLDFGGRYPASARCLAQQLLLRDEPSKPQDGRDIEETLVAANEAIQRGDNRQAEVLAREVLSPHPHMGEALLVAGMAAERQGNVEAALEYLARIPGNQRAAAITGHRRAAALEFYRRGHMTEAESHFRRAVELDPDDPVANPALGYLLVISGRRWESVPFLLAAIKQQQFTLDHLCWLGVLEAVIDNAAELQRCSQASPDDPLPLLGLARLALRDNKIDEAERLLRRVIVLSPQQCEAHAWLGHVLLESATPQDWVRWHERLPATADDHPEVWVVRGIWATKCSDPRGAARCFLEALRRNPNHQHANYQLSQVLTVLGEEDLAAKFSNRTRQIIELADALHTLQVSRENLVAMRRAARLAESLGRPWEAWGWCVMALRVESDLGWALEQGGRLAAVLTADTHTLRSSNLALAVDLSEYPPDWRAIVSSDESLSPAAARPAQIRFGETATVAGMDFHYENGRDPQQSGSKMFEQNGGGVAVIDFDRDGWPDIHLTQGCDWPPREAQQEHLDQLFRNRGDGRFDNVTTASGLWENRYSQGVAVGDFDNDGFPDLYVANIGQNRLFHNLGDGTFEDVSNSAGMAAKRWTASCLLADLNGDSFPDIYDVNYLKGEDVFERVCRYLGGIARMCPPRVFAAEQDQVYINLGNGEFVDHTAQSGIVVPDGRGLGTVAADFDRTGRLSLFVANDQVSNFFFSNETSRPGGELRLVERGMFTGVAVDSRGRSQACMGVAAADANGDDRIDLFVTNFYGEPNCLYLQQPDHLFVDATRNAGLRDASFAWLGFGTQFLDGDLDGWPDIVVANGHIEDLTDQGIPYQMPPKYFRNLGGGHFEEVPAASLGDFFQREHLGRGLAPLDWNRDGRPEFVVSQLHGPTALVTNETTGVRHFLAVQLCGTHSARDAIGAFVRVRSGGEGWSQQLTAGDGYQASNQRQLVFGLGDRQHVDEILVTWPSGKTQSWSELAADRAVLLVEGRAEPVICLLPPD